LKKEMDDFNIKFMNSFEDLRLNQSIFLKRLIYL